MVLGCLLRQQAPKTDKEQVRYFISLPVLASRTFLHAYLPFARLYLQNYCYLFTLNSLIVLLNNLETYVHEKVWGSCDT